MKGSLEDVVDTLMAKRTVRGSGVIAKKNEQKIFGKQSTPSRWQKILNTHTFKTPCTCS